jgi:DNA-binding transcriptional ArsR family regulator
MNAFDATDFEIESLTALFRLLSDKTRLQILILLANGEQNVTWLCQQSKLAQPTVSHHLGLLRASNVVSNRREGKQVFYQVNGRVELDRAEAISIHASDFVVTITRTEGQVSVSTKSHPGHSDRAR